MILGIITICLAYCYLLLILFAIKGWFKRRAPLTQNHSYIYCTVIIAARNEANTIQTTLYSLLNQHYPKDCYNVIVVDDHSTDSTKKILDDIATNDNTVTVLSLPEHLSGKKQALRHALTFAQGELILFTDADCTLDANWIESYVSFASEHKGDLYFGNVIPNISPSSTITERCIALDFIGILGVQNGLANIGHAFSCNGANMCITRQFYQTAYNTNESFTSGDDVFLLHEAKKHNPNGVYFIENSSAAIHTTVPSTLLDFFKQRCRWASKARGYKDKDSIAVALIVYCYCLAMTITIVTSCFGSSLALCAFTFLFITKLIADLLLFFVTAPHFSSKKYIWLAPPFECIYFLYITIVPFVSILLPIRWKNRNINT